MFWGLSRLKPRRRTSVTSSPVLGFLSAIAGQRPHGSMGEKGRGSQVLLDPCVHLSPTFPAPEEQPELLGQARWQDAGARALVWQAKCCRNKTELK